MKQPKPQNSNILANQDHIEFPIRLNRYLYLQGVVSRRQADRFIESGQVLINGKPAKLGQKVERGDAVQLSNKVQSFTRNYVYYLFNKPIGVVSHNPQRMDNGQIEESIEDIFKPKNGPVFPVGRLDKASHGLMFLTNDGRLIDKMLNPNFDHDKEYVVRVDKKISNHFLKHMNAGVDIEGYKTKPTQTRQTDERMFRIILTEGKKHQIRRMCAALGYQVEDLRRVRIMNLKLKELPVGKGRELTTKERLELFATIGLNES
jgi:23S rRNA pseudouridine2604 synthase